jgi:hypothetical protein
MVNRRAFLSMLAVGLSAEAIERALWVPGRKLISIPKPQPDWTELDQIIIQTTYSVRNVDFNLVDVEIWPAPPAHLRAQIIEHARQQANQMYPIRHLRLRTDDMRPGEYAVYPWDGWPKR